MNRIPKCYNYDSSSAIAPISDILWLEASYFARFAHDVKQTSPPKMMSLVNQMTYNRNLRPGIYKASTGRIENILHSQYWFVWCHSFTSTSVWWKNLVQFKNHHKNAFAEIPVTVNAITSVHFVNEFRSRRARTSTAIVLLQHSSNSNTLPWRDRDRENERES